MKTLFAVLMTLTMWLHPEAISAFSGGDGDTVIIEINNKSKIIIYATDRDELENLEKYDINKMLKELNSVLGSEKYKDLKEDSLVAKGDTTIIIGESGAKTRIKIGNMELLVDTDDWEDLEEEFDEDLPVKKCEYVEKEPKRTSNDFNIDFGINNWMEGKNFPDETGQNYSVKPWGSWYIALNSVNKTWVTGPLFIDWGGGVSWYNWKMQDPDVLITQGENNTRFIDTTGFNTVKSKLSVPYINLSFVPVFDFAKGKRKVKNLERGSVSFKTYRKQGLRFGVGGYAGYRLGGLSKFVYRVDGNKEKDREHGNFYLSNFRYGIRAQIGYKGLDIFAMYDLNEVFAEGRGPAGSPGLNAITFGITL